MNLALSRKKNKGAPAAAAAGRPPKEPTPKRPGSRGWLGRGRGESVVIDPAPEYRGSTKQVCGLWPWVAGTGTPMIGVPFGNHLQSGAQVCCDPISWYQRASLISNPSLFVMSIPGVGKTSAVMRMALGLADRGVLPLVLGDTRPDYVDLIDSLDGQHNPIGRNRGAINVLDSGEAPAAAERLRAAGWEQAADEILSDAHGLRHNMLCALIVILRKAPLGVREETILARAITWLDENHEGTPILPDLLEVVRAAPPELREAALDRGDDERYKAVTEELEAALIALMPGGRFGDVFARQTTKPMRSDTPVAFDVSAIPASDGDLRAAALMASWSAGFAVVGISQVLADYGLQERRHYFVIMDELHQALKAGPGLVDRVDYLTRLNRTEGVGLAMVTHTLKDLRSLPRAEDVTKAMGFIERAGMLITGGLPMSEMPELSKAYPLSKVEQNLLASWTAPPAWDPKHGRDAPPPGRGKFLIKVGGRPGIPVSVSLTEAEKNVHMSARRWKKGEDKA